VGALLVNPQAGHRANARITMSDTPHRSLLIGRKPRLRPNAWNNTRTIAKVRNSRANSPFELGLAPGSFGVRNAAAPVLAAVVTVTVAVELAVPFRVRELGEMVQVPPVGLPLQVNCTAEVNPLTGVRVSV
jgi:hypothetical protein